MGHQKNKTIRGQGLVEFALILPVLLAVMVGTLEFGRLLFLYVNVTNATREGARYGMVNPSDTNGILNHVSGTLTLVTCPSPTISYDDGTDRTVSAPIPGGRVRVAMACTIHPITPLLEPFMPAGLTINTENRRTIQSVKTEATSTLAPMAPPTVGEPSTNTPTPEVTETSTLQPLDTETPPPLATATPIPPPTQTPPIVITKPVMEGETVILGQAAPGFAVTLRIVQSGLLRTVSVDAGGYFTFADLPELVAGYTVVVQGYGTQDLAVVQPGPTPMPGLTPTPNSAYIYIDDVCLPEGTNDIAVHGRLLPSSPQNKIETLRFYWDGQPFSPERIFDHSWGDTSFDLTLNGVAVVGPGPHTLSVVGYYKWGRSGETVTMAPVATDLAVCHPTPTPKATPDAPVDLVITDLHVTDDPLPGTYERVHLSASIHNAGETDVTSLFWVDLYGDYDPSTPLSDQASLDYVAINALSAGSTITFTMYVPNGFKTVGEHTLVAMVDTWNQIEESNEDNNVSEALSVNLTVANLEPTPTPIVAPGPTGSLVVQTFLMPLANPQSYVSVYVYDEFGALRASGRSDANAIFEAENLPPGEYVVQGELRESDTVYMAVEPVVVTESTTTSVILFLTEL